MISTSLVLPMKSGHLWWTCSGTMSRTLPVPGVPVHSSVQHGPVEVTHQAANVPGRVRLVPVLDKVHVLLEPVRPALEVSLVERVNLSGLGDLDVVVGKHKVADEGVQGEAVHAVTNRENQHGGGAVHNVPSGQEVLSGPAAVEEGLLLGDVQVVAVGALGDDVLALEVALLVGLEDSEDAAHGDSGVNVGASVQWVEAHDVVAAVGLVDGDGDVLLLARDGPPC